MNCETCFDRGFYLDRRCNENCCDHPKASPPMDCYERPCSCVAGNERKEALAARIRRQELRIENVVFTRDYSVSRELLEATEEVVPAAQPA